MSKTRSKLMFQCISGRHAGEILPNTELAKKALSSGRLDALTLIDDECPSCIELSRTSAQKMWNILGCPTHEDEWCNCPPQSIPDSPYDKQIGECVDLGGHSDLDESFDL